MSLKISLLAVAVLSIGQVGQFAWADEAAKADPQSFSAIASNHDAAAAFAAMKKGHRLPDWVARGGTESPANTVSFGGHDVYVMSACKPHDCGAQRIAVMYDPQAKRMVGVLSVVDPKHDVEKLTWLNIGGDNESIDGRTMLYAALTGSLENHPGAFSYK